jgi:hypothetical protein
MLDKEFESLSMRVGPANVTFQSYLFDRNGLPFFVFFTIWEEANLDAKPQVLSQDWSGWSRVQRACARQRNLGQQSLEFVLSGPDSYEEAVDLLKKRLGELIRCKEIQ